MMAVLPHYDPPAIVQPADDLIEVRRRRHHSYSGYSNHYDNRDYTRKYDYSYDYRNRLPSWVYIGMAFMVMGSDGYRYQCTVIAIDEENGTYTCAEYIP